MANQLVKFTLDFDASGREQEMVNSFGKAMFSTNDFIQLKGKTGINRAVQNYS